MNKPRYLDFVVLTIVLLVSAAFVSTSTKSEGTVTLKAKDAPVFEVINTIVGKAGKTLVVEHGLESSKVTVELIEVPWRQALDAIAKLNSLETRFLDDLVLVLNSENASALPLGNDR